METKVNRYDIYLTGLYGRNRKEKFEIFKLIEKPIEEPLLDETTLDKLVQEALTSLKVKTIRKLSVQVNKVTYSNNSGIDIMTFNLMGSKLVKRYQ